ncbi:uncharacterized protein TNCV_3849771 [Trichonephila clavipes]|nr:uncharacterized protein TNCV_3849771 [Trichonephila clavipes]
MVLEPRYGFLFLKRNGANSAYSIHSCSDTLYENMISCVQAANSYPTDNSECRLKIAYFRILNNKEIVRELHNGSSMNYRQPFECKAQKYDIIHPSSELLSTD